MGYLRDLYGYKNKEFREGVKVGIELYAYWKDGEQYVGTNTPLKVALDEVNKELKQ